MATPATVVPVEYTMTKKTFAQIGGHVDAIRSLQGLKEKG